MIIFRVLCGEWIEPLYEVMRVSSVWAIAFFLPALIVGNFLVSCALEKWTYLKGRSFAI